MISLQDLETHKIGILGFGQEGQAVLKYLHSHGLQATVFDAIVEDKWSESQKFIAAETQTKSVTGPDYLNEISSCTLLFRSPGIWRKHEKILQAEAQGTLIISQAIWFFSHSKAKIIGVTGTKGKGTTCSLIFEVLNAAKKSAYLTGNIGKVQPLEFLDNLTKQDLVVYELSSFQLQDLTQSPHVGICLMTTSDHLNHHSNIDEYHEAKGAITAYQTRNDFAIYNTDYPATVTIGQKGNAVKYTISKFKQPVSGVYIDGNVLSFHNIGLSTPDFTIDCSDRKLRGKHNLENLAAAALACLILKIDVEIIKSTINNFTGLEHRLQLVCEKEGISYFNDSISTVPETTLAALSSFSEPIHLLIGGSDKGLAYDDMVENIIKQNDEGNINIASITFLGQIGSGLKSLFEERGATFKLLGPFNDLALAIDSIRSLTKPGEVVLLSPASASFDMFENYADRGRKFVELVS